MIGFLLAVAGVFPFYRTSRYYPERALADISIPAWLGWLFLLSSSVVYVIQWGPAVGVLVWMTAAMLAPCLLMALLKIPRPYSTFLSLFILFILIYIDYASKQ